MKTVIDIIEKQLDVKIEVIKSRPDDITRISGKEYLSKEELETIGEILLQNGFTKQLSTLYYDDGIYLEIFDDVLVSITHDAEINIFEF